jgi:hypothetical protein
MEEFIEQENIEELNNNYQPKRKTSISDIFEVNFRIYFLICFSKFRVLHVVLLRKLVDLKNQL